MLTRDPHSQITRTPLATPVPPTTRPETRWKLTGHHVLGCAPSAHVGRPLEEGPGPGSQRGPLSQPRAQPSQAARQASCWYSGLSSRAGAEDSACPRCHRWGTCQVGAHTASPEPGFPHRGEPAAHQPGNTLLGSHHPPGHFSFMSQTAQGFLFLSAQTEN